MNIHLIDIVGIFGAVVLLLAYFMVTTKRWDVHALSYQLSNLAAAAALIAYNLHKAAYVNVGINVVWAAVAFVGLLYIVGHLSRRPSNRRR